IGNNSRLINQPYSSDSQSHNHQIYIRESCQLFLGKEEMEVTSNLSLYDNTRE
ncbi:hypothetical protein BDB01DRAFT_803517, partial [Pilobolus umbonatus]